MADKKGKLTVEKAYADFQDAYRAKRKLLEQEREDFQFALGKQWSSDDLADYKSRRIKPVTDNRIQPNIFLLTGLERQNRSEFKAFPEGEEDTLKAEVATKLFKDSVKVSDFLHKTSEQFKDGITCGESHLELYLDYTYSILNGKPVWRKADGNMIFPERGFREYDYSDARYVNKVTFNLSEDDLVSLYPDAQKMIEDAVGGTLDLDTMAEGTHTQKRDYQTGKSSGSDSSGDKPDEKRFDLIERFYKKFVQKHFIGDKATGTITEVEEKADATQFVEDYKAQIAQDQATFAQASEQYKFDAAHALIQSNSGNPTEAPQAPIQPPAADPERYIHFTRLVPEHWVYAFYPNAPKALADERAWYYPKWKNYPFTPYYARFSTAPLEGDDRDLLVQGVVRGVKNVQEVLNKSKTLELLHLNSSTNSGWLLEEDTWLDPKKVKEFGATPGTSLEYKTGKPMPQRVFPQPLSQAHVQIANDANDSIKEGLGINADLLAAQDGGQSSGRAIALRQRQGLLMVQELFDNLSRTRQIAGKFLLTQLGEMYDTETAKKVLGDAFIKQNFSKPVLQPPVDPRTGQPIPGAPPMPVIGPDGQMQTEIDLELLESTIAEVLSGDLGKYDVAVGESVSSETIKMANMADLKDLATTFPGIIPPEVIIEEGMLPAATKSRVINSIKQAQAAMAQRPPQGAGGRNGNGSKV